VAEGIAAWVSPIMVIAAATAVFCTSTALIVGAAGAPQALTIKAARTIAVRREGRFMLGEDLLMKLAIGITSAAGLDAVIPHNDRPIALRDAETAECFEVLFSGDERTGAVIPNGSGKAVSGDDEIPALI
jgi:hypothetical protein